MALPATDNFNRTDANPIGGNWSTAGGYGACQIVSNQAKGVGGTGNCAYWNADSFNNDQYSQEVIPNAGAVGFGSAARITGNTFYLWYMTDSITGRVYKSTGVDAYTQIGSDYSISLANGTIIKLAVEGTTLTPYVDGVAQTTQTDATYASGSAGIYFYGSSNACDDWEGGNIAAGSYTLSAESGSYTKTGTASSLLRSSLVDAAGGTYIKTGVAASLLKSSLVDAEGGSYVKTGTVASLLMSRLVDAASGSSTLTGEAASLLASRLVNAEAGDYALTGIEASLLISRLVDAESGSHALTGQATLLLASRLVGAEPGSFILTGEDVSLIFTPTGAYILTAEGGVYNITGQATSLFSSRLIGAGIGDYALTGQSSSLLYSRLLSAVAGDYVLTGQDTSLFISRLLGCASGSYTLTGKSAGLNSILSWRDVRIKGVDVVSGKYVIIIGQILD